MQTDQETTNLEGTAETMKIMIRKEAQNMGVGLFILIGLPWLALFAAAVAILLTAGLIAWVIYRLVMLMATFRLPSPRTA